MSFSVDLWNGFDSIKSQFSKTHKKIKVLNKILTSYITIETNYYKSLENLFKEIKETSKPEFLLDESFQKVIDMLDNDYQNRKKYTNNLTKKIMESLNNYLQQPKVGLNKCLLDNTENTDNFKKSLNILIEKQTIFHNHCKELGVSISHMKNDELNKTNKTTKNKIPKMLEKIKSYKEDYINCINETNKDREKYNIKTEEILNKLEDLYDGIISTFHSALYDFTYFRLDFLYNLYIKEKKDFDEIHSRVNKKQEINNFIMKYATKEFPMIKIEFCPLKYSILNKYIKTKNTKLSEKELKNVYKVVKNIFDTNNIFKDDLLIRTSKKQVDFFSRRFTFFGKKNNNDLLKEKEFQENKQYIEDYLTDLFTGKITDNKELIKDNENKIKENNKKKNKDNIKHKEL